jgi:predicted RNA-binding Zn-ribbon protein involved in translation (DUF1610 family)
MGSVKWVKNIWAGGCAMVCKQCGERMNLTDKNTMSGEDIREYTCPKCGHEDEENRGPALWTYMQSAEKPEDK